MRNILAVLLLQFAALAIASAQNPAALTISGHVYADDDGTSLSGVKVTLTSTNSVGFHQNQVTATDEHGVFQFAELPEGGHSLYFEKASFLPESVMEAAPSTDIVVRLRRAAVISGRITDTDGGAIDKALVEVLRKSYMYGELSLSPVNRAATWTDSQGEYQVSGLAPGRYYVRSSHAGYDTALYPDVSGLTGSRTIDIITGDHQSSINLQLHRAPRFTLSGQLIDSETHGPAQAKFLRVTSADPIAGTFVDGVIHDGEFRIEGLAPGDYFLIFDWVGPTNNRTRTAIIPYQMGAADQSGVVLRAALTSVSGRLNARGPKMPSYLSVLLEPAAVVIRSSISGGEASAYVAADGRFRMNRVQPGEYRLTVHSGSGTPDFFVADRTVIVTGDAPVTGVNADLDFSAGSVSGGAIDAAGKPIARAMVVLQSADTEKRSLELYRHLYRTYSAGHFTITGVVPGDYLLFAWRGDPNMIGDPELFAVARQKCPPRHDHQRQYALAGCQGTAGPLELPVREYCRFFTSIPNRIITSALRPAFARAYCGHMETTNTYPAPLPTQRAKSICHNPNKTSQKTTKNPPKWLYPCESLFPSQHRPIHNKNLYLTLLAFPKLSS